jgi:hypothetical protein
MAFTAILFPMTGGTTKTNVANMVLVSRFGDLILKLIVARAALHLARHALHFLASYALVVTRYTARVYVFTDVDRVVENYPPVVCVKGDLFGKGWGYPSGALKGQTSLHMARVTGDVHFVLLMTRHAAGTDEPRMVWIIALEFPCLSVIMAGPAVHFGAFFTKIVMAVSALGKCRMIRMIENDIPR